LKQKDDVPFFFTGDFNSGYTVDGSGANGPLGGLAQNLTYCIFTQSGIMDDANDVYRNRTAKCPDVISPTDKARIGGGVDHVFVSKGVNVTSWTTIPGKQAGTDHGFVQIYGVAMPGSGTNGSSQSSTQTLDGIQNFRDAAASSSVLQTGVLYRSGELNNIPTQTSDKLAQLLGTNGTIIDLRTTAERKNAPDAMVPGVKDVSIPIDNILDQKYMVTDPTRRVQIGKALKLAASTKGGVLIHCSAGKDRTGWVVAMIMYNAGAGDAEVMTEYMASSAAFPGGVEKVWLTDGIDAIHSKYGTVNNYLKKGLGLSDGDLKNLNQKFRA
jgi:protein-tyrosine phosphatase